MPVLAIDTGTTQSGYCLIDFATCKPLSFGKIDNFEILSLISSQAETETQIVMEQFAPQQSVGQTTLTALVWYGRFIERAYMHNLHVAEIPRRKVKTHFLGKFKRENGGADAQLRRALVQRFAQFDTKSGKGTKANPDFFFGFATTDVYAAFAVGMCYIDTIQA